jgi:cell division control protein 12
VGGHTASKTSGYTNVLIRKILCIELEEKLFKVQLTVIDTPGFGDYVNNRNNWDPIIEFLDDQHESFMRQEQQPARLGKIDMRVHACLYFIRPTGHTLVANIFNIYGRIRQAYNLTLVLQIVSFGC